MEGQLVEAVLAPVRLEKVGQDHRVPRDPGQADALALEDDEVVLDVLARLRTFGSSRTGRRMSRARSLGIWAGAPEVIVADGDVKRLARDEGERQPDEAGPGRGPAMSVSVSRATSPAFGDPRGQGPELVLVEDRPEVLSGRPGAVFRKSASEGGELELAEETDGLLLVGLLDGVAVEVELERRGRGTR